MKLLLLALLLIPQDDGRIAEWIRDLGDDAIDVRERALAELVRAGRRAEKALREAMKGSNDEVRGRAAQVLAEIEKGEQVRRFEAGPSRITLKRKDAPLREVLDEIQKQTPTRIASTFAPEQARVTVAFDRMPLFEAIDSLCRAAGTMGWAVDCRRDDSVTLTVSEGKFADAPRLVRDQYAVRLEGMQLTTTYDLQGGETSKTRLEFRWGWEKGTRPQRAILRVEELVDDLGTDYAGDLPPDAGLRAYGFSNVQTQQSLEFTKVPPDRASKFSRIKGSLDLEFPETMLVFAFEKPEESAGAVQKREGGTLKLLSCARDKTRLRGKIEVTPADMGGRLEMKAIDKQGREVVGRYTRGEQGSDEAIVMWIEFTLPAEAEAATLRFQSPAGHREKKIPFEFKDVRFR